MSRIFLIGEMLSVAMISPQTERSRRLENCRCCIADGGDDIATNRTGRRLENCRCSIADGWR